MNSDQIRRADAVVVGAGFAGLYLAYRLRELGMDVEGFEGAPDVGGTWYWNRYPGARCDVESVDYCYSWSDDLIREWEWTERYPAQPEILAYLRHVAARFDLRRLFRFETWIASAVYDPEARTWTVRASDGSVTVARFCIMATGVLSAPKDVGIPGVDDFEGDVLHSARWPDGEVAFAGRRVGVVGTGSTGIQIVPEVAKHADEVVVFQRTPTYSIPARNRPLPPEELEDIRATYAQRRELARHSKAGMIHDENDQSAHEAGPEEREREYAKRWEYGGSGFMRAYNDLMIDGAANATAAQFVRGRIDELVADPAVADLLKPKDFPIGARRIALDTDYYLTFNLDHVRLVDARRTPIEKLTRSGVATSEEEIELDAMIFATGFDALTGALTRIDVVGRDGQVLRDVWANGPRTYLGLAVAGFPNLFIVTGPGSPSVLGNVVVSIEQHVDFITELISHVGTEGVTEIEADEDAQEAWVRHVNDLADATLYPRARSWYTGDNVPGKPHVFMPYVGGVDRYRAVCDDVASSGYRGFIMRA